MLPGTHPPNDRAAMKRPLAAAEPRWHRLRMVIELLSRNGPGQRPLAEYLQPRGEQPGQEPEERVVFGGVTWENYLALDRALGDDRPGPRLYYLEGELEIMTTSAKHELVKTYLGDMVGDFMFERGISAFPRGQATMRILKEAGAEPDESWCIAEDKDEETGFPDLVIEIVLTSGGIEKLEIYRRFGVAEVWFWRRDLVEVWRLRSDASGYERAGQSTLLPGFDFELLTRCLAMAPRWIEARRAFREGLRVKE